MYPLYPAHRGHLLHPACSVHPVPLYAKCPLCPPHIPQALGTLCTSSCAPCALSIPRALGTPCTPCAPRTPACHQYQQGGDFYRNQGFGMLLGARSRSILAALLLPALAAFPRGAGLQLEPLSLRASRRAALLGHFVRHGGQRGGRAAGGKDREGGSRSGTGTRGSPAQPGGDSRAAWPPSPSTSGQGRGHGLVRGWGGSDFCPSR